MPPPPYLTHLFPSTQVHRVRFTPFDDTLGVGHARGFDTLIVPGAGEPNYDSREADPYESKRRRREREVNSLLDKVPMDLITLDQDVLGRVDRDAIRPRATAGVAGSRKQGAAAAAEVPFAKKSRAERLQLQGRAALAEDEELSSSDEEGDADVDEDAARRAAKAQKRIEMADNKNRMRGKSSGIKKALRKRRRNVIDPQTVSQSFERASEWRCVFSLAVDRRRPNHALPLTDSGSVRHQLAGRPQGEARTPTRSEQARQGQQARAGAGLEWDAERARPVRGEVVVELLRGHCAFNHLHDHKHTGREQREDSLKEARSGGCSFSLLALLEGCKIEYDCCRSDPLLKLRSCECFAPLASGLQSMAT